MAAVYLDNTVLLYGSPRWATPMSTIHKHCPSSSPATVRAAARGQDCITRLRRSTPLANAMLGVLHSLGLQDVPSFGDSTGALNLNATTVREHED